MQGLGNLSSPVSHFTDDVAEAYKGLGQIWV